MKNRISFKTALGFSALTFCSLSFAQAQSAMNESTARNKTEREVAAAVDRFYVALNAMFQGDLEPMKQVWSHSDDVYYMGPGGGIRRGWPEVLADWEGQAALKLGGKVEPQELFMTVGPQLAIVINEEKGQNTGPDGDVLQVSIRATHVFRKEQGEWKMIGDHADLLPFLQE